MKRDKTFKFPKPMKVLMASIVDKKKRDEFKNSTIEAIIYGNNMVVSNKKKKKDKSEVES